MRLGAVLISVFCTSLGTSLGTSLVVADACVRAPYTCLQQCHGSHWLSVGPEVYHVKRTRDGGSVQRGHLYGARLSYDRIKHWGIYWGANGHAAGGRIKGHTGDDAPLRSELVELGGEARLGYTLPIPARAWGFFTPFAAGGYFREVNDFLYPTPLEVEFCTEFGYFGLGFLAGWAARCGFYIGVAYETQWMMDGHCRIREDPDEENVTLLITDRLNMCVDIYITQGFCIARRQVMVGLVPFYRCRHYGGRENFPFDFFDTRYYILGVRVLFSLQF